MRLFRFAAYSDHHPPRLPNDATAGVHQRPPTALFASSAKPGIIGIYEVVFAIISFSPAFYQSKIIGYGLHDIKTLQTIMGHADIETALDRYTHFMHENVVKLAHINPYCDT